jgi:hypothetical protein
MDHDTHLALRPKLISFDVFGTLISVRDSSYSAFERILADAGAHHLDVKAFWEHWEHRNIAHFGMPTAPIGRFANSRLPKRSLIFMLWLAAA